MKNDNIIKYLVLVILAAINIYLAVTFFGTFDVRSWIRTAGITNDYGILQGFKIYNMAYPPLASVMLWVVGKISNITSLPSWISEYPTGAEIGQGFIPIKLSLIFFLFLLPISIYIYERVSQKNNSVLWFNKSLFVLANPAFILSTAILGYLDIYFAPFFLLSFIFFHLRKYYLAGIFLTVTFSIKLIPIFAIPVFLSYFIFLNLSKLRHGFDWKGMQMFVLGVATVIIPLIDIYGYPALEGIFKSSAAHGDQLTANATNLNLLIGTIIGSNTASASWISASRGIFYFVSGLIIVKMLILKETSKPFFIACILIFYTYFIFFTGVHENHLIPALIASLAFYTVIPSGLSKKILINTSLIVTLNLFVYYWFGFVLRNSEIIPTFSEDFRRLTFPFALATSIYAVVFYAYMLKVYLGVSQKDGHAGK